VEKISSGVGASIQPAGGPELGEPPSARRRGSLLALAVLAGALALLFWRSFVPGCLLFSNDRPLGLLHAEWMRLPSGLLGRWADLNSLGFNAGSFAATPTTLLLWVLGPVGSSKFLAPASLCLLGMAAWFAFRRLGLSKRGALLGALAAAFSSTFLSMACWGETQSVLSIGMCYLSIGLAASASRSTGRVERWGLNALAGLAAGVGILEAPESGAISGLIVVAYVVWSAFVGGGTMTRRLARGLKPALVVVAFAALMAGQSIIAAFKPGVATDNAQAREQRWRWATQWSLPKKEAASLIVPGLFGFRMDTPAGGQYWGSVGRDPALDEWFDSGRQGSQPPGLLRFVGGGNYLGVPVVLVALWATLRALRRGDTVYSPLERKLLWFWSGLALLCLLLAFGRFAPFYRLAYALPGFATMRNPVRFLEPMALGISMLFAYGLTGLWRQRPGRSDADTVSPAHGAKTWWSHTDRFDRWWAIGCVAALGLSLAAWLAYAGSRQLVGGYLASVGFDAGTAHSIAAFSVRQAGWFLLVFALGGSMVVLVLNGSLSGARTSLGALLFGLLVVFDLGRADLPWLTHWDYRQKYATNDVLEFLKDKPYEHRVSILPFQDTSASALLNLVYYIQWAQHHFPYYGIQSLDIVSLPRMPKDLAAFEGTFRVKDAGTMNALARRWQLTNTRYLIGPITALDSLNDQFDPVRRRFEVVQAFKVEPARDGSETASASVPGAAKPASLDNLTAVTDAGGPYAIFEFTGALPRARLYSHWQAATNDQSALEQLGQTAFDPERTVLVNSALPADGVANDVGKDHDGGTVEFVSYTSTEIVLQTKAEYASVLLLNDRFDPQWSVTVDGKPAPLLRCNYIMRGVQLPAGAHMVRFTFRIPLGLPFARLEVEPDTQAVSFVFHIPTGLPSYLSLGAYGVGLVLLVLLAFRRTSPW
jgi:hypothetical protein